MRSALTAIVQAVFSYAGSVDCDFPGLVRGLSLAAQELGDFDSPPPSTTQFSPSTSEESLKPDMVPPPPPKKPQQGCYNFSRKFLGI